MVRWSLRHEEATAIRSSDDSVPIDILDIEGTYSIEPEETLASISPDSEDSYYWWELAKAFYEDYHVQEELNALASFLTVHDSKNFSISNVKIKTSLAEVVMSLSPNYVSIHGVSMEGVNGQELMDLGFDLLSPTKGSVALNYHAACES